MNAGREYYAATLLSNGKPLIAKGYTMVALSSVKLYGWW
jgi:hypothetical protein